jgi:hypothetical protein
MNGSALTVAPFRQRDVTVTVANGAVEPTVFPRAMRHVWLCSARRLEVSDVRICMIDITGLFGPAASVDSKGQPFDAPAIVDRMRGLALPVPPDQDTILVFNKAGPIRYLRGSTVVEFVG